MCAYVYEREREIVWECVGEKRINKKIFRRVPTVYGQTNCGPVSLHYMVQVDRTSIIFGTIYQTI